MKHFQVITLLSFVFLMFSCQTKQKEKVQIAQIVCPQGEMLFWMYDETPKHKNSFIKLAKEGYWDSLTFNRVIPNFVVQGGCPDTPEGFADSPYLIEPEFHDHIKHIYGAVGAGRDDNPEKISAGCQFYIVQNKEGLPRLDGRYMIFGQIFKGFDVLEAIAAEKTDSTDKPLKDITMDINIVEYSIDELIELGYNKNPKQSENK